MPASTFQPEQLLHHIAAKRVLICKECQYAIQPSAISRHLKEIHQIYRSDRQDLLNYSQSLNLASPGDVVLPEPHEAPIPFLPTESGLACEFRDCGHLCASTKRMKSHWSTVHRDVLLEEHQSQWRPVKLQTFFRGNQLRYFIVSGDSIPPSQPQKPLELSGESSSERSSVEMNTPEVLFSNGPDHLSAEDLILFENFRTSTYLDIGHTEESRMVWQTVVPLLAREHDFLMHGILAISALHLATLDPPQKKHYQLVAACHQDRALPAFRAGIANPTEHNGNALVAFLQLLVIHSFASEEHDEYLLLVKGIDETGLPDWLYLIRGSCDLFAHLRPALDRGPLKNIIDTMQWQNLPTVPRDLEFSRRLGLISRMPSFSRQPSPDLGPEQIRFPLPVALLELSRAFEIARAAQVYSCFSIWTAVYLWPPNVSLEYLELLKNRDPTALVLLAHYCILLKPLESDWFMTGFAKRLVTRIYNQLDPELRHWVQWPMDEVGQ